MARERATKKQQELLQYISDFLKEHDYAPSYREVMTVLGYKSVSTVAVHVDGLIAKGYLTKTDKSARSIRLATPRSREATDALTWLRQEVARRQGSGTGAEDIAVLEHALEILDPSDDKA